MRGIELQNNEPGGGGRPGTDARSNKGERREGGRGLRPRAGWKRRDGDAATHVSPAPKRLGVCFISAQREVATNYKLLLFEKMLYFRGKAKNRRRDSAPTRIYRLILHNDRSLTRGAGRQVLLNR